MTEKNGGDLRVLIIGEHASTRFGGEAILPWHYFVGLRRRGIEVWLVVHERTRDELVSILPGESDRIYYVPDTTLNKITWRVGRFLPQRLAHFTLGYIRRVNNQRAARTLARQLIANKQIGVVHQPIPVSPREPSIVHTMGAPVVIGPMNGNMAFPPGLVPKDGVFGVEFLVAVGRFFSNVLNWLMPGKRRACALLAANARTRHALPTKHSGEVITLAENGVDLDLWTPRLTGYDPARPPTIVYMGRLVDWKAVDILLYAIADVHTSPKPVLEVIGDGPTRLSLERLVMDLNLNDRVSFLGWQSQVDASRRLREADLLALPSLFECGGAVVLEAMASAIPVVATDWGGPSDYIDSSCGILVRPDSFSAMVRGFAEAITRLCQEPELRVKLGRSGRQKVERNYDWVRKIDRIIEVYERCCRTN